ncbi:hypothetical protein KSS87_013402 [Heliosperma pusillum]|nr:hypothetical protein KSS87_008810 [Heliosperma pusillum]KAH9615377.1 hypothetical protein KSS87_013402 [Heliosperma pusillum]
MSTTSRSNSDVSFFDAEELLHIEERCRELRREKDLLRETQSQSFDLIKKLELHVRNLNDARLEDKRQIQDLQRELENCHQEIDYLQDQLNEKNGYTDSLDEHVNNLNVKLSDFEVLEKEIISLREELKKSNSECEFLMHELETKEAELQKSCVHIEKLEESLSLTALEYQCEIESMKREMMSLGSKSFEPDKIASKCNQETPVLNGSVLEPGFRLDDKGKTDTMARELLEYENIVKKLKDELKEQKSRAKEESEDLAQEMAELRYQMMELLEEERKRRSCIEQASLLRISELEAQLQMERG